jgi:hypothetical protein
MGAISFGGADLGEQGQCLLPVRQGGVRSRCAQRMAEHQQGVGLAEAVADVALDRQGVAGRFDGLIGLVVSELEAGQGGQCLAFEEPIAGLAGQDQGLLGVAVGLVKVVAVLVGGGQPENCDHLGIPALVFLGQPQRLLVVVDRLLVSGLSVLDGGQGVEGVGLEATLAGVTGASASSNAWPRRPVSREIPARVRRVSASPPRSPTSRWMARAALAWSTARSSWPMA